MRLLGLTLVAAALLWSKPPAYAADFRPDEVAFGAALDREDPAALKALLTPGITTPFGQNVQTRKIQFWLMRSYVTDHWSRVQICLEARVLEKGTWTEWLPTMGYAFLPIGDSHPSSVVAVPGYTPGSGEISYLATPSSTVTQAEAAKYVADSASRNRSGCDHSSDESQAAIMKGLLKHLIPAAVSN